MSDTDSKREETPPLASLKALKGEVRILLRWVVAMLLCVLFVRVIALDVRPVQGPSMLPGLSDGDRVLIWKLPFVLEVLPFLDPAQAVAQGDLVVFEDLAENGKRYVKRVVAKGPHPPPSNAVEASADGANSHREVSVVVEDGNVFVDNHLLEEPYVLPANRTTPGRYDARLDYDQLYLLGDNRDVSKDSRRLGPIPAARIQGRVVFRVWPLSKWGTL